MSYNIDTEIPRMTTYESTVPTPEQYAQALLNQVDSVLGRAVEVLVPEKAGERPLEVFPSPTEVRDDAQPLSLFPEQEAEARGIVVEFGFGRETDMTLSEQGLFGAHVIIEGGQPHKIMAEAKMVLDDTASMPATIVFSASKSRTVSSGAERTSADRLGVGADGEYTEYDVARRIAEQLDGFVALDQDEVMPFGYDIHHAQALVEEPTGQLTTIGYVGKTPVVLLRVDREDYTDESGNPKYRLQPTTADLMRIVGAVGTTLGDEKSPVAFVTSATYQPSRMVDGAIAALGNQRIVGVATYGTARLAAVKGEAVPAPASLNQLPGELHKTAEEAERLRAALGGARL